jgi:histidine triad (HIT) family protein
VTISHAPDGYQCPFCGIAAGRYTEWNQPSDLVARNDNALAFIAPRWWPRNEGHVLVVPAEHYENLYELPSEAGHAVHDLVRDVAIAIRQTYGCDGTSTRQHNEPAGYQDVWHYHVHVSPRYHDDQLYRSPGTAIWVDTERRRPYAEKIRSFLATR